MDNRFRLRFTFWLDLHKDDERWLADQIELLKNSRTFASTIRDGIRLITDLRAGQTTVLFELFPWIKDSLQPSATPSDVFERMVQMQAALDVLTAQARQHANTHPTLPSASIVNERQHVSVPTGGVEIVAAEKGSAQVVANNFLSSMKSLASGFFD